MNQKLLLAALTAAILSTLSCSKDQDNNITEPEKQDSAIVTGNFYKLLRVENFQGDTTNTDPTAAKATMYYSLEANTARPESYVKTSKWDLSFSSIYGSFIGGNNGRDINNYGHGTTARGGILILEKAFDSVINIPADDQFNTRNGVFGTDNFGAFGVGTGWYLYDFGGDIVGDKTYDKQHVAYALSDTLTLANGTKVIPRTLVVRTAGGNYAKIKMISVYKDAFTLDKWSRNAPHMYFTFEYVMVPAGSTKFEIR